MSAIPTRRGFRLVGLDAAGAPIYKPRHLFMPVRGHPDDDECTYRSDGTDATYCGLPEAEHGEEAP